MSTEVLDRIETLGVVPAIVLGYSSLAADLAAALYEGGLPCAEVTLRTPSALETLQEMARHPGLLIGAGTVMNVAQAQQAIAAGAKFIVSPGVDEGLIRFCMEQQILIIPGACTPTEVMLATNLGVPCIKFFPCDAFGGMPVLKALNGPFPNMRFMPTGGISLETTPEFLAYKPVLAVGGTWMVKKEWLDAERFDIIAEACAATMAIIKQTKRGVDTSNRVPKLGGKLSGFGRDTGLSAISKATVSIHEAFMGE
jgi:2-dehydro-3-deoxyphosphogluconate aldolase/(4S)-4-hydroxy-2-oxoglutarate aldolase